MEDSHNIHNIHSKIAIVGMSCRVPGAANYSAFWENLLNGVESVRDLTDEELLESGVPEHILHHPQFVKRGADVDKAEYFDAGFFDYSPRDAEITDPQHRSFLECAWEALEDAACIHDLDEQLVGVYASSCQSSYVLNLYSDPELVSRLGNVQLGIGNEKDFLASKTAFRLGLKGPAVNVQTACSSSLVAVHLACQALLGGECDMALAGGVTIRSEQTSGYMYQKEGMVSPDGHCRVFDTDSQGTVFGNGLGIVVLKRLEDALRNNDRILSVICSTAVNNDGSDKLGFTAPSPTGQARVIYEAMAAADLSPAEIGYIETHGTGTELGDAVEIKALKEVFQSTAVPAQSCAIGSVKPNIGHSDTAAGIIGLIKATLSLHHGIIPPCINHQQPNPRLQLEQSPFYVNTNPISWSEMNRYPRAGVSSFGIGGTNAHIIMEQAPSCTGALSTVRVQESPAACAAERLFLFSAKTEKSLEDTGSLIRDHFKKHLDLDPGDTAYTLQVGRAAFGFRKAIVCATLAEAAFMLEQDKGRFEVCGPAQPSVTFHFDGNNAVHSNVSSANESFGMPQVNVQITTAQNLSGLGLAPDRIFTDEEGLFAAAGYCKLVAMSDLARIWQYKQEWKQAAPGAKQEAESALRNFLDRITIGRLAFPILLDNQPVSESRWRDSAFWLTGNRMSADWTEDKEVFDAPYLDDTGLLIIPISALNDVSLPRILGRAWELGAVINWKAWKVNSGRQRVGLPTYAFDKQKYWRAAKEAAASPLTHNGNERNPVSNWFYKPVWKQYAGSPSLTGNTPVSANTGYYVLFMDESESMGAIRKELLSRGHTVYSVIAAQDYQRKSTYEYCLAPNQPEHYQRLFKELREAEATSCKIVYLWSIDNDGTTSFYNLMHIGKCLEFMAIGQPIQLYVVTSGYEAVLGDEPIDPALAAVMGPVRVFPQEFSQVQCSLIDLVSSDFRTNRNQCIDLLIDELIQSGQVHTMAIRGRRKWIQQFELLALTPDAAPDARYRKEGGVHLLIGGLGDIGMTMAQDLAKQGNPTLILTGRTAFPPKAEWEHHLIERGDQNPISLKIAKLLQLEAQGARIEVFQADVGDERQMNELFAELERKFGQIDGILYSAGAIIQDFHAHSVSVITKEDCESHFRVKLRGLEILEKIIRDKPVRYCLLNSSISTVLGGIGMAAYAAANHVMDSFALRMNQSSSGTRWMSVNWDVWDFSSDPAKFKDRSSQWIHPQSDRDVLGYMYRLIPGNDRIVISVTNLDTRMAAWVNKPSLEPADKRQVSSSQDSSVEQLLISAIRNAIGVETISLHDNFFEIGITSLDIVAINNDIQQVFQKPILISLWFQYPTVYKLAEYLKGDQNAADTGKQNIDRSEILHKGASALKRLKQRGKEAKNDSNL